MYRIYLLRSEAYRLDNFDLEVHFDVTFLYLATYSYVNAMEYSLFISEILHPIYYQNEICVYNCFLPNIRKNQRVAKKFKYYCNNNAIYKWALKYIAQYFV